MTRKKLIATGAILLIAMIVLISFFRSGSNDYADDILEMHTAMNVEGQTSFEKIDEAMKSDELDESTALEYKVLAIFGDERLPEAFNSGIQMYEGSDVMREVSEKWDDLSDETKVVLEPFKKRPDEDGSWVEMMYGEAPDAVPEATLIPRAIALGRPKEKIFKDFLVSNDGKVKIWYASKDFLVKEVLGSKPTTLSAGTTKKMAEQVKFALDNDHIIDSFETLMEKTLMDDGTLGGDGKLDIYMAPLHNAYGVCPPDHRTPTSSFIILDTSMGAAKPNLLKTVLAHEIFHSFQFLFPYKNSDAWWAEATATWAEDFIYPDVNSEHAWIPSYFYFPSTALTALSPPKNHEYSAYLFAFFMAQKFGDDIIHQSWKSCGEYSCLGAVNELLEGGFKKQWREFTLWNYNQKPAKFYIDLPEFPKASSASNADFKFFHIKGEETSVEIDYLDTLTATIKSAVNSVESKKVKQIIFKDFNEFTKNEKASIKAIVRLRNSKSYIEDWTDKKQRAFCLDVPEENIDEVTLIFSNGNEKETVDASKINIITRDNCYHISQTDEVEAMLHLPYTDADVRKVSDVLTTIHDVTEGTPVEPAKEGVEYGYQTKWEVGYEFSQVREAFLFDCFGSSVEIPKGWTNRDVGVMSFDLSPESVSPDNTFDIDITFGYPHPDGPYQEVPDIKINCFALTAAGGSQNIPVMTKANAFKGRLFDMTEDGARIEIINSCYHNSCNSLDGAEMQTMTDPIILQIKQGAE